MHTAPHPPILIIEDSNEDYEVTVRSLQRASVTNQIFRCVDGDEALDFLYREGRYATIDAAPRPGLILLDLNLPGTDGREILGQIKQDPLLRSIPVVVLTTSRSEQDVAFCYAQGANTYITKCLDLEMFRHAIAALYMYWFGTAVLPEPGMPALSN
jgi:CheY-like chemotaxis protein